MTAYQAPTALYGCMGLGGSWDAEALVPADVTQAEVVLTAALDAGFTWFDHADIYRHGRAEEAFGEVLARAPGLRERIGLQTKCGITLPRDGRPVSYDLRGESIRTRLHRSLERLRTDHVDVLLLHRPDPLAEPGEIAAALTALHAEGVVRHVGVSNTSAAQIVALQEHLALPLVVDQLEMSLHRRDWVEAGVLVNTAAGAGNGFPHGTLEHCARSGVALQAWGALAQGRYTGQQQTPEEHATAELVRTLAERHGTTPETVVLWWLQRHPAGIAPVVGTTDPSRIRACADAVGQVPALTREEWYLLWTTARGGPLP